MELLVYGYCINDIVQYRISDGILFNIKTSKCIYLRKTMARLLSFLLINAKEGVIADEDILYHVWEKNELRGSGARLWQVMTGLRSKLENIGLADDFVLRVSGQGYVILERHITPLLVEKNTDLYPGIGEHENADKQ